MKKPHQIPTGWEQIATYALASTATGAAFVVPNASRYRKYVIGIGSGAGAISNGQGVRIAHAVGTAAAVATAMRTNGNHPTFFGPFRIDEQLYATFPAGGGATTLNVTIFASIEGEIDELIRYLHGLTGGGAPQDGIWVDRWDPQDFVEAGGINFFTTSTRNGHPILQAADGATVTGGAVNGVLPSTCPVYWDSATIRVYWAGTTVGTAEVAIQVAFERIAEGILNIDGDDWGSVYNSYPDAPAVAGVVDYSDFTLSKSACKGIEPGELFRMFLRRNPLDSKDLYAGIVDILAVAMWINK